MNAPFTQFKIVGWGWYYLSTVLDDYSRYILSWKLTTTMNAQDVQDTLEKALEKAGIEKSKLGTGRDYCPTMDRPIFLEI